MYNVRIKSIIKVIKIRSKIILKIILMTKPVILNPYSQKAGKKQTTAGSGGKILKFCLRIKAFPQMLKKEVFFPKFRTMILNIAKIHKSLKKQLTSDVLIFKIVLKD